MKKLYSTAQLMLGVILCLSAQLAYASPSDDLSKTLNAMHSMKANFVQTTYDNQDRAVQTSKGQLAFVRPGKFRWEAKKPVPQLIIANGKQLWIVDSDLMQVTIRTVKKEIGETPTMLLSENVVQLEKRFFVSVKNAGSLVSYQLKPKKTDSTFVLIELQFKNNQIIAMHLEDQLGHVTKISFTNLIANPALSPSLFRYVPAADMDVIRE